MWLPQKPASRYWPRSPNQNVGFKMIFSVYLPRYIYANLVHTNTAKLIFIHINIVKTCVVVKDLLDTIVEQIVILHIYEIKYLLFSGYYRHRYLFSSSGIPLR